MLFFGCMTAGMIFSKVVFAQDTVAKTVPPFDMGNFQFEAPVRLTFDGKPIKTEAPGYAAPAMADIDNDGKQELLVGQFAGGKIKVYRDLQKNGFGESEWLQADGAIAEIPGVW